jgi:hypothetical protein
MTSDRFGGTLQAAATFEQFVDLCVRADDEAYLLALTRLRDVVGTVSELAGVVQDLVSEGDEWWRKNQEDEDKLRSEIVQFRQSMTTEFPALQASAQVPKPTNVDVGQLIAYERSLAHFDALAGKQVVKSRSLMPEPFENQSVNAKLQNILVGVAGALAQATPEENPEAERVADLQRAIRDFGNRVEWLHRERINQLRSSAFMVWVEVDRRAGQVNPPPQPEQATWELNKLLEEALEGLYSVQFEKVLYGMRSQYSNVRPSADELKAFRAWRADLDYRLEILRADIVLRLRVRGAAETNLRRYAARCMWYRREELAGRLAALSRVSTRGLERVLAADAAAYLFDRGFNVVTELTLGVSRFDVFGFGKERPLLLEAKIYRRGNPKRVLLQGVRQLQDYASRLEAGMATSENWLILFRLGGRKLDPPGSVTIGQRTFRIVQVDLSTAAESGRRATGAIPIAADEIVSALSPAPKVTGARRKQRGVRRGTGRPRRKG